LSGAWRHISEWVWLAAQAGLPTPDYKQDSHDEIDETTEIRRLLPAGTSTSMAITVGEQVFGPPLPPAISAACTKLATISKTAMLGIELAFQNSSWIFAGATPMPDLRIGGEPLLDALAVKLYRSQVM
jgi:hypothetical protein